MLAKLAAALRIFRMSGWAGIINQFRTRYRMPIPQSRRGKWKTRTAHEIEWWDAYLTDKGLPLRLDPDLLMQDRIAELLPQGTEVADILDVRAGPLTFVGKKCAGKIIRVRAVDPLAHEYDRLLKKHAIEPLVRTERLDGERLTSRFSANSFDLVFARNSIDHSYDPERVVLQMLEVVKAGCYVLMEHHPDEAEHNHYTGLHQWNFSMNDAGEFIIGSKRGQVNVSRKYAHLCRIQCEVIDNGEKWLITRILKSEP